MQQESSAQGGYRGDSIPAARRNAGCRRARQPEAHHLRRAEAAERANGHRGFRLDGRPENKPRSAVREEPLNLASRWVSAWRPQRSRLPGHVIRRHKKTPILASLAQKASARNARRRSFVPRGTPTLHQTSNAPRKSELRLRELARERLTEVVRRRIPRGCSLIPSAAFPPPRGPRRGGCARRTRSFRVPRARRTGRGSPCVP